MNRTAWEEAELGVEVAYFNLFQEEIKCISGYKVRSDRKADI